MSLKNEEQNMEIEEVDEMKACNCERSKCLKLYCECFAHCRVCTKACNCRECENNHQNQIQRIKAIQNTLDKNPVAFQRKQQAETNQNVSLKKGCTCKKSGCLKNYCECYQKNAICSHLCKCIGCQNDFFHKWSIKDGKVDPQKDPTSTFLTQNNFGFAIGINMDQYNKKKNNYFDSLYAKNLKEFEKITNSQDFQKKEESEKNKILLEIFMKNIDNFAEENNQFKATEFFQNQIRI